MKYFFYLVIFLIFWCFSLNFVERKLIIGTISTEIQFNKRKMRDFLLWNQPKYFYDLVRIKKKRKIEKHLLHPWLNLILIIKYTKYVYDIYHQHFFHSFSFFCIKIAEIKSLKLYFLSTLQTHFQIAAAAIYVLKILNKWFIQWKINLWNFPLSYLIYYSRK